MLIPSISASDAKFENPIDDHECVLTGSQLKNKLIWPRHFGCKWGCYRFGCGTSCNLNASVKRGKCFIPIRSYFVCRLFWLTRNFCACGTRVHAGLVFTLFTLCAFIIRKNSKFNASYLLIQDT